MPNDVAQTTVTSSGISGSPGILGVAVTARAMKGGSGPQNAQLGVRTASTDYFTSSKALSASLGVISNVWETNPNSAGAWTAAELTAAGFNIGVKSIT